MNVIAVVAHPDDELMCAGTLARLADEGHDVEIKFVCESETPHRRSEAIASTTALGVSGDLILDPDDQITFTRSWVSIFDRLTAPAGLIITHRPDDTNQTHAILGQIMRAVCRKNNKSLWQMDQAIPGGWDTTSPRPNLLVNITAFWSYKMDAVNCYQSQLNRYPFWWTAIETRDRHYGWMLDQGNNAITHAEGFIVEKSIWL